MSSDYACTCPACGATVSENALVCPNCRLDFDEIYSCPDCGADVSRNHAACPNCGTKFDVLVPRTDLGWTVFRVAIAILAPLLGTAIVFLAALAGLFVLIVSTEQPPSKVREDALKQVIQAAINHNERYVADADKLGSKRSAQSRIQISRPAWDVLVAHSGELANATTVITTTSDPGDNVESEILIVGASFRIRCNAWNGGVIDNTWFHVYDCLVR